MPVLGFGTWQLKGQDARRMVEVALEQGYRHLDTAQIYHNETEVGAGLEASGLGRDEVFVTTKVWTDHYGEDALQASVRESLEKLRLDSVDLLLLHWPVFGPGRSLESVIERLVEARERGYARHIGVSNFTPALVDRAWSASGAPLVMNQVEYHPFLDQTELLTKLRERGMALTAYCPVAQGAVGASPALQEIGRVHGKSPYQVTLRWLVEQPGVIAIPRTSNPDHCRQNLEIFDFELTADQRRTVAGLARPDGRQVDPEGLAPDWG